MHVGYDEFRIKEKEVQPLNMLATSSAQAINLTQRCFRCACCTLKGLNRTTSNGNAFEINSSAFGVEFVVDMHDIGLWRQLEIRANRQCYCWLRATRCAIESWVGTLYNTY